MRARDGRERGALSGSVEPGVSPSDAAHREKLEEVGLAMALDRIGAAVGGDEYRVGYANVGRCAYVSTVCELTVVPGVARPGSDEIAEAGWFEPKQLQRCSVNHLAALRLELGYWE